MGWGLVGLGACRVGLVGGNVHGMGELWGWGLVGWGLWVGMFMECSSFLHSAISSIVSGLVAIQTKELVRWRTSPGRRAV